MSKKTLYLLVSGDFVDAIIDKNIKKNPIETFSGSLTNQVEMDDFVRLLAASGISSGKAIVVVNHPDAISALKARIQGELEFINFPFYDVFDVPSCYSILVNRRQAPYFEDLSELTNIAMGLGIQTLGFGAEFVKEVWDIFLQIIKQEEALDVTV